MKKFIVIILVTMALSLTGCGTEASKVSYNLSQEADNFNDIRQVTVINCLQGDVLFQMTGKMSITADIDDKQLEIVVEDITSGDVSKYKYTLNFNPNMWVPVEVDTID